MAKKKYENYDRDKEREKHWGRNAWEIRQEGVSEYWGGIAGHFWSMVLHHERTHSRLLLRNMFREGWSVAFQRRSQSA